ncbi:hypothetical protein LAB1_19650 [Roseibium sp. LAB1]
MRAAPGQLLGEIEHFPQTPVPRDKSEIGIEGRKSLIDVVKCRLHQIKLRLELLCLLHEVRLSLKDWFDHSSEKRMAVLHVTRDKP